MIQSRIFILLIVEYKNPHEIVPYEFDYPEDMKSLLKEIMHNKRYVRHTIEKN